MNLRFAVRGLVIFVAWMAGSYLVHGTLLHGDYAQYPNLYRAATETQELFPWMLLAHALLAGALVWTYGRGREERPWLGQGLRFGVALNLLTVVPTYTIYYVVQPISAAKRGARRLDGVSWNSLPRPERCQAIRWS